MPLALPPHLTKHAFSVGDARALDVPSDRLRRADLVAPHHGVRALRRALTPTDRCRDLLPVLPAGARFSHLTAVALWELPLPRGHDVSSEPLHVEMSHGRRIRRPGVVGHARTAVGPTAQTGPGRGPTWHKLYGVPVVDPLTAWVQSAASLSLDDLVVVADALAGRWSTWAPAREVPMDALVERVAAWGSRRGASVLRRALAVARPGVWSPQETRARLLLERGGVTGLVLNEPVFDRSGRKIGTADLAERDARVAIEYQGDHHRTDRDTYRSDLQRREDFEDAGWRQVQVSDDDLGPGADVFVRRVRRLVIERSAAASGGARSEVSRHAAHFRT